MLLVSSLSLKELRNDTFDTWRPAVLPNVLLQRTYSIVGGELATPIREFQDASGTTWLEAIFVNGQHETLERQPKTTFRNLILQEVRR